MKALARTVVVTVAGILAAASLMPLVPTEWWAIRLLDFPRLQLAFALLAVFLVLLRFLSHFAANPPVPSYGPVGGRP